MKKILFCIVAILTLSAESCGPPPTATQIEAINQEKSTLQAVQQVGMPAIVNYQEKRMMKQILELRDTQIVTVTYIVDLQGKLHKICDSIGYGLPYATQYTNPQMDTYTNSNSTAHVVLPQADPNGLYSPASAEGTWVLCSNPAKKGETVPVYIEPRVIVSPFELSVQ